MKKQDLDALRELYSSVYGGEQLDEAPLTPEQIKYRNERARLGVISKGGKFVATGKVDDKLTSDWEWLTSSQAGKRQQLRAQKLAADLNRGQRELRISRSQDVAIAAADKAEKAKAEKANQQRTQTNSSSSTSRPTGSPPAAKPSGVVLARKNNVTGTLDKSTGKFTEKNWTDAETQRYQARAAQNAARTSASSGGSPSSSSSSSTSSASAPKPPTPAIGKLGSTSFERRTPTSAELRAAQRERATQKASGQDTRSVANVEKALQAAQKTNLPTTGPSVDLATARSSVAADSAKFTPRDMNKYPIKPNPINNNKSIPEMKEQSQEWPSTKTIRDIADAYASIYEAKKNDGNLANNYPPYDKVTRGDVIAGRLGKDEMGGKKKSTKKEEFEYWVNSLVDEGYDLSDYTWDDMYEIYEQQLDEATRMRKELGKEGETRVRGELAARSGAYQRSGSVDKTIAAAERAADRTTPRGRNESPGEYKQRMQQRSRTLRGLAASRRGSVRDKPRASMRGYAAKVEGPDKDLQAARQRAMSAGTLTPKEKKQLGEEYAIYEIVASYLLENNFAETINDANVIIENMSEVWLEEILNNN